MLNRRQTLGAAAAALPAAGLPSTGTEDDFWRTVRRAYDLPRDIVNLENGNWGVMARPVLLAYERHTRGVNEQGAYYARRGYGADFDAIRTRLATALGVGSDEIAVTRGATEALQAMISGYNRLREGDAVLLADLDYDSMQTAMRWLERRRGVRVVEIALTEPATHQGLIDAYEQALKANPAVRLMLLTYVSHRTGLVLPVHDIIEMARARNVDVILDAAHAWGQINFTLPDTGADFVGLNLHKWIGAPIGVGVAYIKRDRIGAIDPFLGEPEGRTPVDARIHTGTSNYAAVLAVPDALDWHEQIGADRKAARLKALRQAWVRAVEDVPDVQVLTPQDPRLYAGITSFRIAGKTTLTENRAIASALLERDRIFTVHRSGVAAGACVRVTPGVFNSMDDMGALAAAVRILAGARP